MGRDYYDVPSTCGTVCREIRREQRIAELATQNLLNLRDTHNRKRDRARQMLERCFALSEVHTEDLRRCVEAIRRFPTLRHFASALLYAAHTNGRLSQARQRIISHLQAIIREEPINA